MESLERYGHCFMTSEVVDLAIGLDVIDIFCSNYHIDYIFSECGMRVRFLKERDFEKHILPDIIVTPVSTPPSHPLHPG